MRPLSVLLKLPKHELTNEEAKYLKEYQNIKRIKHSGSFIYHSRKLPEEPHGINGN